MLCIAAFIVLLFLAAVSAKYRRLLRRAWSCVTRRVTFRPCDTTFRQDVKDSLLAPLALRAPRLVAPASVAIEVVAWVMVLSLVVSLYIVARSGLNLAVYGTCDKADPAACSLSATQGCGIGSARPGFGESLRSGDVIGAVRNEAADVGDTVSALPRMFRSWDAAEYALPQASYQGGYRDGRPTALEVIDPGCQFCAQLFANVRESGFAEKNNVTYIVYPIGSDLLPRFANSPLIARYLTAVRLTEAQAGTHANNPTDWLLLENIFVGRRPDGVAWQTWFNEDASPQEATAQLQAWLAGAGYDQAAIAQIAELAASDRVRDVIAEGKRVVDDDIQTVTIPSMIADGRLHMGAISAQDLAEAN
ncbi:hypothetical protein KILIM_020_00240 [Kineosphaera limosa NBRC 100340]|uniref:Thioredoxin-like fold domain-containing protein n=1 Tax=Kineosphaera limosa NBRC 100340 TaxID=1184609 RepID=K6WNS0_9MICO|nr:hypothetical protein [Kineosphaera limosa]GAB95456.1 hypothetical protein KILIM_020_00240 [Kineosphaera limosa NBRC 100340]